MTAIQRLGTIWLEQGSPLHAAPFLLVARQMAPENVDARAKLALVFLYAGQFEDARKEALAILDQAPSHEDAMRLLAASSLKKEDLDDAEQRLRSLNANDKPGFHVALASISSGKGDFDAAQSDLGISRPTLYELMEKLGISNE